MFRIQRIFVQGSLLILMLITFFLLSSVSAAAQELIGATDPRLDHLIGGPAGRAQTGARRYRWRITTSRRDWDHDGRRS